MANDVRNSVTSCRMIPTRPGTKKCELSRSGLYSSRGRISIGIATCPTASRAGTDWQRLRPAAAQSPSDRVNAQQVRGVERRGGHLRIAAVDQHLHLRLLAAQQSSV